MQRVPSPTRSLAAAPGGLGDLGLTPVLSGLQRPLHTRSRTASDDDPRPRRGMNEFVNREGDRVSLGQGWLWLWTESHSGTPGGAAGEVEAALLVRQAQCRTLSAQEPARSSRWPVRPLRERVRSRGLPRPVAEVEWRRRCGW